MSEDDTKSDSWISQLGKTKNRAVTIWGAIGFFVFIGVQSANFIKQVATTAQVDSLRSFVISENAKQDANIDAIKERNSVNADKIQDIRKVLGEHLEEYVADLAYNKAKKNKNATAARARLKFKKAMSEGRTLEQAFDESQEGLNYWPFERPEE